MEVRLLGPADGRLFEKVAEDLFDNAIDASLVKQFLADPRHHLVGAIDEEHIVGFASAVHYIHPDKASQLFINEVGVSPAWQQRGVGKELVAKLFETAQSLGCTSAWVLTEDDNLAANRLYSSVARAREIKAAGRSAAVMFEYELDRGA